MGILDRLEKFNEDEEKKRKEPISPKACENSVGYQNRIVQIFARVNERLGVEFNTNVGIDEIKRHDTYEVTFMIIRDRLIESYKNGTLYPDDAYFIGATVEVGQSLGINYRYYYSELAARGLSVGEKGTISACGDTAASVVFASTSSAPLFKKANLIPLESKIEVEISAAFKYLNPTESRMKKKLDALRPIVHFEKGQVDDYYLDQKVK